MIHSTSIIDSKSKISKDVEIGPYCIIGPDVEIGSNTKLHSHVSIKGHTKIGKNNEIFPFVSIGTSPQDLKYKGEKNSIIIGDNNKLREYVNINPGTSQGGTITKIGVVSEGGICSHKTSFRTKEYLKFEDYIIVIIIIVEKQCFLSKFFLKMRSSLTKFCLNVLNSERWKGMQIL